MSDELKAKANRLAKSAISLDCDTWGNPRYYLPAIAFVRQGEFYRPKNAVKYRGKKYGAGWVFHSWNLAEDLYFALSEAYRI